jgi:hypothetical protein
MTIAEFLDGFAQRQRCCPVQWRIHESGCLRTVDGDICPLGFMMGVGTIRSFTPMTLQEIEAAIGLYFADAWDIVTAADGNNPPNPFARMGLYPEIRRRLLAATGLLP